MNRSGGGFAPPSSDTTGHAVPHSCVLPPRPTLRLLRSESRRNNYCDGNDDEVPNDSSFANEFVSPESVQNSRTFQEENESVR